MAAVLVTGMSGSGKSTILAELGRRGYHVADTDYSDWIHPCVDDGERTWDPDRTTSLLMGRDEQALFVGGARRDRPVDRDCRPGFDLTVVPQRYAQDQIIDVGPGGQ